ncbi:MAG: phosphonate ABC transporter, permease protein PhnE, partial [Elioraea sp.]|nr:phosphonate ABC transporter, permease protein PhnE [Elioraea sp.]
MTANAAALAVMSDAVARVEHARAMARRQRRIASWGYGTLFLALVLLSAWASDFSPAALAAGLPRIGEYFALILPDLRADRLFADSETEGSLAYWMYRLDEWAWLLFETA